MVRFGAGATRALIAACAFCGASAVAHAEVKDRATLYKIEDAITVIGQRSNYGGDATSTATKTDTLLRDVPQSISVITRDLIEDQAMRSMADVVRYAPGVSMGQGEGHRDAPTLRGNSSTADFYVDGVRDDVQYYRDLYNAERIEILKGPNAMIFGRGGGGGVINRVTKQAGWDDIREIRLQGGSFASGRGALDLGGGFSSSLAGRINAFYENSESYRDYVELERFGVNPTASLGLGENTEVSLSYEYFNDDRTVDRGVPSENGLPYAGSRSAFFGNPDLSFTEAEVNLGSVTIEHEFAPDLKIRNHLLVAGYDKFYQNVHAGSAVDAAGDVALQAYFSGTDRRNIFNQTDLVWKTGIGAVDHTLLFGFELGSQHTENFRAGTNNVAGVVNVANPTTFAPVVFNPLSSDNEVSLGVAAVYLQDQIALNEWLQLIGGVRFDHFNLEFDNHLAGGADFKRTDNVVSPRGGVVLKPMENASVYASYSISFLPQSGDQFGSLDATTSALKPERFENIEVGAKWDIRPGLALTAALYRLDRDNTRALDPMTNQTVLTGSQRSKGVEAGLAGALTENWEVLAGYSYQEAEITSDTTSAPAGRTVPLVPRHSFSLWTAYQFTRQWGAGVGVTHQDDSFASISNAVTLPSFTRVDAAVFFNLNEHLELQANVENLFNELYWGTAHNDNNITPGSPRSVRVSLTGRL